MSKGQQYIDMQGVQAEIERILENPPYSNADSSVYKIMHYLESILYTDQPAQVKKYIESAISHIEKNKQETTSDNLKEKLKIMKEYCQVRAKYTNIFEATSGLKKMLSGKVKTNYQALLDDLSNLNKLLIEIEEELEKAKQSNILNWQNLEI